MRARNLQYRVGCTAFPNPNSVDNNRKANLRKIITEAEGLRKTATLAATLADAAAAPKVKRIPKILKKPEGK